MDCNCHHPNTRIVTFPTEEFSRIIYTTAPELADAHVIGSMQDVRKVDADTVGLKTISVEVLYAERGTFIFVRFV